MRTFPVWSPVCQTARLASSLAICLHLSGCIGLPLAAAGNPLMAVISPLSSAIGMTRGLEIGMRLSPTSAPGNAAPITEQEKAHFETLNCPALHNMADLYTPAPGMTPDAQSFVMKAVGARLELLSQLMQEKGCSP